MSNVIAQFHKGKYVNKPVQLGTTLAKNIILEDGDSVEAKFHRLVCNSNGELAFKGKNVVRTVNGVEADAEGNVSMMQIPDYSAGVTLYTNNLIPTNGILSCRFVENATGQWGTVSLDDNSLAEHQSGANINGSKSSVSLNIIVNKGQKITTQGTSQVLNLTFYPFKVVS